MDKSPKVSPIELVIIFKAFSKTRTRNRPYLRKRKKSFDIFEKRYIMICFFLILRTILFIRFTRILNYNECFSRCAIMKEIF